MKNTILLCLMFLIMPLFATNIYNGDGTDYPSGIDDYTIQSAASYWTYPKQNDLGIVIVAMQTEFGTNPSGTFSTVRARLDYLDPITSSTTIVTASVFQSSMSIIESQYVSKISTGNIYNWNNGTISKQSNAYIVYGSTTAITSVNTFISINNSNQILSATASSAGNAAPLQFKIYTTSFSFQGGAGSNDVHYWQAIVR